MNHGIRESMTLLPAWLQPFLTWLTGQALPGQAPLFRNTPGRQIAAGFGLTIGGALIAAAGIRIGLAGLPLIAIGMTLTVSGARYLQTNILHQGAHDRLTGHAGRDRLIGYAASALALIATPDQYRAAHLPHHDADAFATVHDPDFRFFRMTLRIEPGLSLHLLWRRVRMAVIDPRGHARYLATRLRSTLRLAPVPHRAATLLTQAAMAALLIGVFGWTTYLIAWVLPIGPLFQVFGLLQYLSEHVWLRQPRAGETRIVALNRKTVARSVGERVPASGLPPVRRAIAWIGWWLRLLTLHLFLRLFVLQGPLTVHDYHHRTPLSVVWPDSIHARRRQVDSGDARFQDYENVWGLRAALDLSLTAISEFPPLPPSEVSADEARAEFQTM